MTILPAKSAYQEYDITNSGIVVRIFLEGEMVHYGAMTEEKAHEWIDQDKKERSSPTRP